MTSLLSVENLCKKYSYFSLDNISFSVEPGRITGFIGKNGAGKTTVLKSIMNLTPIDGGSIRLFGLDYKKNELEIKQRVGFSLSELTYYPETNLKTLVSVTKRFYRCFDDEKFSYYAHKFNLNLNKKIRELSTGMKVKYSVALSLSHNAELLILDEPTSGLDPVSRNDIVEIFEDFVSDGKHSVLFSEHITSDLDRCADDIVYISNGKTEYAGTYDDFVNGYMFVKADSELITTEMMSELISYRKTGNEIRGLVSMSDSSLFPKEVLKRPDIEQIMVYKERSYEKFAV